MKTKTSSPTTNELKFKIIASDLDGTLLTPEHRIAPYTRDVLKRAHQQGATIVIATGRHYVDVTGIRDRLGIPAYMITSNGARVHNPEGEIVFKQNVQPDDVKRVVEMTKSDTDIKTHLYRNDDWLLNKPSDNLNDFHENFTYQLFDSNNPPSDGISKIFFIRDDMDHERLVHWEQTFVERLNSRAHVSFSTPWCLEIMDKGVSKGHALEAIAKANGCELKDCIAFGDGMNDVEMLKMAGKGLVMETSHEKVKRALPNNEILGPNSEESVARYLESHVI